MAHKSTTISGDMFFVCLESVKMEGVPEILFFSTIIFPTCMHLHNNKFSINLFTGLLSTAIPYLN